MKKAHDSRTRISAQPAVVWIPREDMDVSSGKLSDLVEYTGFAGTDPTQLCVFLGGLSTIVFKTVPECNCTVLSRALIKQCMSTPIGWSWLVDLQELHACDPQLLETLVAIGEHLHSGGGRLSLYNLDKVPMPQSLRDQFLTNCANAFIQVEDSEEAARSNRFPHKAANTRPRFRTQRRAEFMIYH